MRFSVKTKQTDVRETSAGSNTDQEAMESLVLQMVSLCMKGHPEFEGRLMETIEASKPEELKESA